MKFKKYYTDTDSLTSFPALIQASGEPLVDYSITGNTGGVAARTANLYNWQDGYEPIYPAENTGIITQSSGATYSIIVEVEPSTTYTFSIIKQASGLRRRVGMCANYPQVGDTCLSLDNTTDDSDTRYGNIFTTTADTHYVLIMFYSGTGESVAERAKSITVQEGESLDYVPFYVIPVTSGGVTTNLPIDSPLGLTDTLTYTDTGIAIPTFDGDNTISFGTTVQPSAMSAEYKGWHSQDTVRVYNNGQWE